MFCLTFIRFVLPFWYIPSRIFLFLRSKKISQFHPSLICYFLCVLFFVIYLFIIHVYMQNDYEADGRILNVSFSAKRPDLPGEVLYTQQFLQERVYLRRHALTKLTTLQVIMFTPTLPLLLLFFSGCGCLVLATNTQSSPPRTPHSFSSINS